MRQATDQLPPMRYSTGIELPLAARRIRVTMEDADLTAAFLPAP
ncbi:hypothetical protein [Planctellipticum variicoloris]